MRAFDTEPSAVKAALIAAFHDWKIRTRGRCHTWFGNDWLHELLRDTWDQAGVVWETNRFAIPAHEAGRELHIFSDVAAHREDLDEWINSAVANSNQYSESRKGRDRPGRKPGSGSFAKADEPLVEEMAALIAEGRAKSIHDAATKVVHKAAGPGGDPSRVRRLTDRYKATSR